MSRETSRRRNFMKNEAETIGFGSATLAVLERKNNDFSVAQLGIPPCATMVCAYVGMKAPATPPPPILKS
jgi:hypothetical protein